MPINISKATSTEYALVIGKIPNNPAFHATDTLRLNVYSLNLPSVTVENSEYNWQGKHVEYHTGGITFDPLNINFLVDSNFANWRILFDWMMYIADNKTRPTNVPNNYVTDANILVYDNFGTIKITVTFKNLWIQTLGELSLSTREGETLIESNAIFQYDRYEIK